MDIGSTVFTGMQVAVRQSLHPLPARMKPQGGKGLGTSDPHHSDARQAQAGQSQAFCGSLL